MRMLPGDKYYESQGVNNDNYNGRTCCLIKKCYQNICGF